MYTEYLNIIVHDYLAQVDPKLAKKFKKEANVTEELPSGSPAIGDVVRFFNETSPKKLKRELEPDAEEETVVPKKDKKAKKAEKILAEAAVKEPAEEEEAASAEQNKKVKKAKKDSAPAAEEVTPVEEEEASPSKKSKKSKKAKKD
eukprot:TRINITY_DN8600_c0_g1_i1.p1 TRINITY_DN8600_c0_g1~~TRINITY_DN8600_c0_g1_i1.p1  ORF type:complete len:146 (-),score=71.17 TRINITY_DN8600_c0_g1_i1:105-542(-)